MREDTGVTPKAMPLDPIPYIKNLLAAEKGGECERGRRWGRGDEKVQKVRHEVTKEGRRLTCRYDSLDHD